MENFIALFFGLIPISRSPRVGSGARGWPPSWRTFPGLREGIQIHGRNLYLLIKKKVQFTIVCMSLSLFSPAAPAFQELPIYGTVFSAMQILLMAGAVSASLTTGRKRWENTKTPYLRFTSTNCPIGRRQHWSQPLGKGLGNIHVQTDAGKDCLHVGVHPSRGVYYAGGEYESVNREGGHIAPQQVYACSVGDTDDWRQQMVASHGSHRCRKCC